MRALYQKSARWRRILRHQHAITPIVATCTIHISEAYDMARFRKQLGRRKPPLPFVAFIEQAKSGRPHFHLLFKSIPAKKEFRNYIKSCLQGERFRMGKVIELWDAEGKFAYVTKLTQVYTGGRSVFTIGDFWDKPTDELSKITPTEVQKATETMAKENPLFLLQIALGVITPEQLKNPAFRSYWKRQMFCDEATHLQMESLLWNNWNSL